VTFPYDLDADSIVDELTTQLRPLADRGLKPDHIEISEQYAERLDARAFLRGHMVTIAFAEGDLPAWGGHRRASRVLARNSPRRSLTWTLTRSASFYQP
jgi:hypothetical protein